MKAASSTGAWIVTGGLKEGVSSLVGEAVAEYEDIYNQTNEGIQVMGIANWGKYFNSSDFDRIKKNHSI